MDHTNEKENERKFIYELLIQIENYVSKKNDLKTVDKYNLSFNLIVGMFLYTCYPILKNKDQKRRLEFIDSLVNQIKVNFDHFDKHNEKEKK